MRGAHKIPATKSRQRSLRTGQIKEASWREKEDLEKFSKKNGTRQATRQDSVPSEECERGGDNENLMHLENG